MSKARTSPSSIAGRRASPIGLPALAADLVRRPVSVIVGSGIDRRAGGQGRDRDDSDRVRDRRRPSQDWSCRQPQSAGRQRHRDHLFHVGARGKAARVPAASSFPAPGPWPSWSSRTAGDRVAAERSARPRRRCSDCSSSSPSCSERARSKRTFADAGPAAGVALIVGPIRFFTSRSAQIVTLAARHAVAGDLHDRGLCRAGGLMSYGASV